MDTMNPTSDDLRVRRRIGGAMAFRIVVPCVLCIALFCLATFAILLPGFEKGLLTRKRESIRELTRTVCALLGDYQRRVELGELSVEEAQGRALERVRQLRYGPDNKDYFWVSDLTPRVILHPYRRELEGRDVGGFEAPDGTRVFLEAAARVKGHGTGYMRYSWQWKDDPDRVVPKLSYVQLFEPWGWVVGTGMYLDDVKAEIGRAISRFWLITLGILAVVALLTGYMIWQGIDRERARQQIEERLRLLSSAVEQSTEGIALIDRGGCFMYVNDAYAAMHGYNAKELVGQTLGQVYHDDQAPGLEEAQRQLWERGQYAAEFACVRFNGETFPGQLHSSVVFADTGEPIAAVLAVRDITARKNAERALRESERNLATLMSNLPGMAYRCKNAADWEMEFVSEGCHALTGYRPEDLVHNQSLSFGDIIHADDRNRVWREIQRRLNRREPFRLAYRIIDAAGQTRWVWEQGTGVFDETGELLALEGFVTDITERKQAEEQRGRLEEQLHQAQKMEAIGQLADGVAHDFNNLLTIILAGVDQLREMVPVTDRAPEALSAIERATEQATGVTRSLLTFSHRMPAAKEPVDLRDALDKTTRLLGRLLPAAIEIDVDASPGEQLWVEADATQLQQVVLNLAINARDAMSEGGRLRIVTRRATDAECEEYLSQKAVERGAAVIEVADTGVGIPPELQPRIFEPFFTTKARGQGTGLGLAIVHGIIRDHGGRVGLESEVGRGTVFRVCLPILERARIPIEVDEPSPVPRGAGERLLLAEDNQHMREILASRLGALDYQVDACSDGQEALARYGEYGGEYRLIVLDLDLPKLDGLACIREIRRQGCDVPVVVITGSVRTQLDEQIDEHTAVLRKPFQVNDLARLVSRLLEERREEPVSHEQGA